MFTFPLDVVVQARLDGLALPHPRDLGHRVSSEWNLDDDVLALVEVCRDAETRWYVQFWCS